jgi:hypothetical protein
VVGLARPGLRHNDPDDVCGDLLKGRDVRWSEEGFHHLLHPRLAWNRGLFEKWFEIESSPSKENAFRIFPTTHVTKALLGQKNSLSS